MIKTVNFGGELRQEKIGFWDRKITALVRNAGPMKTGILHENIDSSAALVNSATQGASDRMVEIEKTNYKVRNRI